MAMNKDHLCQHLVPGGVGAVNPSPATGIDRDANGRPRAIRLAVPSHETDPTGWVERMARQFPNMHPQVLTTEGGPVLVLTRERPQPEPVLVDVEIASNQQGPAPIDQDSGDFHADVVMLQSSDPPTNTDWTGGSLLRRYYRTWRQMQDVQDFLNRFDAPEKT